MHTEADRSSFGDNPARRQVTRGHRKKTGKPQRGVDKEQPLAYCHHGQHPNITSSGTPRPQD